MDWDIERIVKFSLENKCYIVDKRAKIEKLPVKLPDGRFISLGNEFTLSCPQSATRPSVISTESLAQPFEFASAEEVDNVGRPKV